MSVTTEQGAGLDLEALRVSMCEAEAAFELLARIERRFDDASLARPAKRVWQVAEYAARQAVVLESALWDAMNREGDAR